MVLVPRRVVVALISVLVWCQAGCSPSARYTSSASPPPSASSRPADSPPPGTTAGSARVEAGLASYYGQGFHGKRTASGERFDMYARTAAHRTLPFNTRVRVTLVATNRSVVVRINDRGPFKKGRIIDLSYGAAREVGLIQAGVSRVRVEVLD